MAEAVKRAGLWGIPQMYHFPTIVRSGLLANGHAAHYFLNYSAAPVQASYGFEAGKDVLSGNSVQQNGTVALPAWGVAVIEEGAH